ncbi:hypothetical protein F441_21889 [Phytophthora nicotianae CJ01A1]|uniref:Uncharacterized protein n=1 Tax=Phytophthora nicotianae CJ01A1 TaxID=1317063 RepID=W2VR89_PHYNI|nr:hypothetical protein F441_21889 [Phytophthora nicotianae CJ01A1]
MSINPLLIVHFVIRPNCIILALSPWTGFLQTFNEVERLFSRAGLVLTVNRRAMHPTTLETLLFLEYNRTLWDPQLVASAVQQLLDGELSDKKLSINKLLIDLEQGPQLKYNMIVRNPARKVSHCSLGSR